LLGVRFGEPLTLYETLLKEKQDKSLIRLLRDLIYSIRTYLQEKLNL
jgi:hypothetical protein